MWRNNTVFDCKRDVCGFNSHSEELIIFIFSFPPGNWSILNTSRVSKIAWKVGNGVS